MEVVNAWSAKWASTTTQLANCVPVTQQEHWLRSAATRLASACASLNTEVHVATSVLLVTMASPTAYLVNVILRAHSVKSVMPPGNAPAWLVSPDFSVTNVHLDTFLTQNATRVSATPTVLCKKGFYNYPLCEGCNCNPAGILPTFGGCGSLTSGELCECKERVTGRICDQCRPLYWSLKPANPQGCEECECHIPGTVGGLGVCDGQSGQCLCKPNVGQRQCTTCIDGTFMLQEDNLLGCQDCGCDVGGSVGSTCDQRNGQCPCRPRITGRRCSEPLQAHYFPTLHQHQYEVEDGHTPSGVNARFDFDEALFPGFSWRGYAIFSNIQKEILLDLRIQKPGLYQVIARYVSLNGDNMYSNITFTPDFYGETKQSEILILPPSREPRFQAVVGPDGVTALPFVLNPGRWTLSIKAQKPVFMDYIVLLPEAFYEATLLQEKVKQPCLQGQAPEVACVQLRYPALPDGAVPVSAAQAGYVEDNGQQNPVRLLDDQYILDELRSGPMAHLTEDEHAMTLELRAPSPGRYVFLLFYHSLDSNDSRPADVSLSSSDALATGKVNLHRCKYNMVCRQVVVDHLNRVLEFGLKDDPVRMTIDLGDDSNRSVSCVRESARDCHFLPSLLLQRSNLRVQRMPWWQLIFQPPSRTMELAWFSLTTVIQLSPLMTPVPEPGPYVLVAHYFQPDHPAFELTTVLESGGQQRDTRLPLEHCPWTSGCRAVLMNPQTGTTAFPLIDNFTLNFEVPDQKSVWLDHLMLIREDQFDKSMLQPLPLDKAVEFIKQCGQNSLHISTETSDFCKEAVFSITAEYNNGALPCQCNIDGSLSFECERFGGQCQCKDNSPASASALLVSLVKSVTPVCHSPFGYTRIVGCEECNCNPHGVQGGNLQCDLQTGQCKCKNNIVGRTCDECKFGFWDFPRCRLLQLAIPATPAKPGTFFLEESNPVGCTKCFCFGTTDRCNSALLFRSQIVEMDGWTSVGLGVLNDLMREELEAPMSSSPSTVEVTPPADLPVGSLLYFVAPSPYLGNKACCNFSDVPFRLRPMGGTLSFSLSVSVDYDVDFGSIIGPDVIITGNNLTLVHEHGEQPAAGVPLDFSIKLVEGEFRQLGGRKVTREQLMTTLVNIDGLYIRASYIQPSLQVRLSNVALDTALSTYLAEAAQALTVEQCHCPPNYKGTSCEECAPGYYRSRTRTAPYLGFCVPCQCNNHGDTCDVVTGKCYNCRDNTYGDHCEKCLPGYHGDATRGHSNDCLICACPIPTPSNNFAESCEVSPSGQEISCNCKKGYFGARCDVCDAGYFGMPDTIGSSCEPCQCSGNIDPENPASCDTVTGECVLCLNNTSGPACELCAPGFYGDAIMGKNCRKCSCDTCGMHSCDAAAGTCNCHDNVIGEYCDQCAPNHWGFSSCQGCRSCDCGLASQSKQCDLETGQCSCQPGAGGLRCETCEPGYWRYSPSGCISCNCAAKFSAGAVCNQQTGQCQCLPGVIGEKCDSCPHRWVFVERQGCNECGEWSTRLAMTSSFNLRHSYWNVRQKMPVPLGQNVSDLEVFGNGVRKSMSVILSSARTNDNAAFATKMAALQEEADVNKTIKEMQGALEQAQQFSLPVVQNNATLAELRRSMQQDLEDRLYELANHTARANTMMRKASGLLHMANSSPFRGLVAQTLDALGDNERRLRDSVDGLQETLAKVKKQTYEVEPIVREAVDHSHDLERQAEECKSILYDTKQTSASALAYDEIVKAVDDALNYSRAAKAAADEAHSLSVGIIDRASDSKDNSEGLLADARELERHVDYEMKPRVGDAVEKLATIELHNKMNAKDLQDLARDMDNLQTAESKEALVASVTAVREAVDEVQGTSDKIDAILERLPGENTHAETLSSDNVGYQQALLAASSYIDRVVAPEPDLGRLANRLLQRHNAMKDHAMDIQKQLEELRRKVALAKDEANRVKIGMEFKGNEWVRLKNPEDLQEAATYTHLSLHVKTDRPDGTLFYLGNGQSSQPRAKRSHEGDFMSLVLRDGYPVLLINLGDGIEEIRSDKYVADGMWHQIVVDRTGKTVNLEVRTESVPETADIPLSQRDTMPFIGYLEELQFGGLPVGLWNFHSHQGKLEGCQERDSLIDIPSGRGLRFDGTGYAIVSKERRDFNDGISISMKFRTYAKEGLLFLIHNRETFMALELRDGHVVYKFNLGSGMTQLKSNGAYNDGQWHQLRAAQLGNEFDLTVGGNDSVPASYRGPETGIDATDDIFVGGPSDFSWSHGGCPPNVARVVSFSAESPGFVAMPFMDLTENAQLTLKFRTKRPNGLIFYTSNEDHSKFLALGLRGGRLFLQARPGGRVETEGTYDDGRWHYVTASSYSNRLRLDIDDALVVQENAVEPVLIHTTSPLYFGGLPPGVQANPELQLDGRTFFVGCLGDSTVRGVLQNFAATADRFNAALTSCPLPGPDDDDVSVEETTTVTEGPGRHSLSGPLPGCVLPLEPAHDSDVTPESGLRFGNSPESRLEFRLPTDLANSLMEHSTISLEFRTRHEDGILFYVTNSNKVDFIAIFMKQGRVNVMFNCGTGPGLLTTTEVYNLGEWHSLEFSRRGQMGVLYMDNTTAAQGSSQGTTSSINVKSPVYLGGLPRNVSSQVKNNLRGVTGSFPGCIRKLEVQDRQMLRPRVSVGVTGCSQKVETGTFFGANHSHLILYDSYNVGKEMTVELDIKPRRPSGILFAVHSNNQKDFVLLQMIDGNIVFSADNGAGIIKASASAGNLCDGEWHTVKAVKNKNIVSLAVGGISKLGIGRGGVTATDTANPLYIGGVPDPSQTRAVATQEQYVGCIRYLQINGKLQSMAESTVHGNVQLNSCPTI
ncbi:hypothetical protein MRX96_030316 [Rhipicephalus microplus]